MRHTSGWVGITDVLCSACCQIILHLAASDSCCQLHTHTIPMYAHTHVTGLSATPLWAHTSSSPAVRRQSGQLSDAAHLQCWSCDQGQGTHVIKARAHMLLGQLWSVEVLLQLMCSLLSCRCTFCLHAHVMHEKLPTCGNSNRQQAAVKLARMRGQGMQAALHIRRNDTAIQQADSPCLAPVVMTWLGRSTLQDQGCSSDSQHQACQHGTHISRAALLGLLQHALLCTQ